MLLIGKPSISMGHLYHGYVKSPEGICISPIFDTPEALIWPNGTSEALQLRKHGVARWDDVVLRPFKKEWVGFNGV